MIEPTCEKLFKWKNEENPSSTSGAMKMVRTVGLRILDLKDFVKNLKDFVLNKMTFLMHFKMKLRSSI
jgi:hypothetical protein